MDNFINFLSNFLFLLWCLNFFALTFLILKFIYNLIKHNNIKKSIINIFISAILIIVYPMLMISLPHIHDFEKKEIIYNEDYNIIIKKCKCGEIKEEKEIHKHDFIEECYMPKRCKLCNFISDEIIYHTVSVGICTRCKEAVIKDFPITINYLYYEQDFLGGNTIVCSFTNNTDKIIKYINFSFCCFNNVGDIIKCNIRNSDIFSYQITGPINGNITTNKYRFLSLYNSDFNGTIRINNISIIYMDDTTETITLDNLKYYNNYLKIKK